MVAEVRANTNPLTSHVTEDQFRALAENIPTLCWMADATGYIHWYNPRWYEYTGTTPEIMRGWGWQSVHDPRSLGEVLDRWAAAITCAQPFEMVIPIRGADGISRPFLTRINPAFDDQGNVTQWFGVNTDISAQREAEDAFQRSEAKFRVLADSMPQIVWCATPDGQLDYYNARWYEYTGMPIGSTDGTAWAVIVHQEDLAATQSLWAEAVRTGTVYRNELRMRDRAGAYKWHLSRALPERDGQGRITRWYGTCTEIEEIVRARDILQRSRDELEREVAARTGERNLLATLVETTDVCVMAIDQQFNILAINPACIAEMQRVYGVQAQAGDNLLERLAGQPEQRATAEAAWRRALSGEVDTVIEARGNPAFARSHYEIKFRRLLNAQGETIGAFQFATDISARIRDQEMLAQAQEALRQSQKLESMGQLTGGVAHDFNNLLTPILGSLDLLRRRGIGSEREQRLMLGAMQSAERAKTLVQRLLAFARRQPLQAVPFDAGALIEGLADLFRSTLGPQASVKVEIGPNLPLAKADPHQLEMALLNLGVNARDALDGPGTITLSARRAQAPELEPGDYLRIGVADTGSGMDEETRARAVEPFFSTKGIGKGTGLGLSMAHGLALQLGGALTINSAPGAGTEVVIWLPETTEPPPPDAELPGPRPATTHAGLVLLVDDEEHIRAITADMLSELGFKVHTAASAAGALQALDSGLAPDLLITDHLMPGMTGVELAYELRSRHPGVKVLVVSGFAEVAGIDPALPRLTKPFVQRELAAALAELML